MGWKPWESATSALKTGLSVIPGIGGYMGQTQANQTNADIATARNIMEREEAEKARKFSSKEAGISREFNAAEAALNRKFTEQMSNTAVSRRMADMKKSGVNPILAGKFDASTPAGSMASSSAPATSKANAYGYESKNAGKYLGETISGALNISKIVSEIAKIQADTEFTKRKKDMTDPINSLMELVQSMIDTHVGSAKERKQIGDKVKTIMEQHEEGQKIRRSPGIEVTPHVNKSQQRLKYKQSKKNRSSNRSKR